MKADGYAVLVDDKGAPEGFWFAACYTDVRLAMQVAAKQKGRMVPVYFAPPDAAHSQKIEGTK